MRNIYLLLVPLLLVTSCNWFKYKPVVGEELAKFTGNKLYKQFEFDKLYKVYYPSFMTTREKLNLLRRRKHLYEQSVIENINRGRFTLDQEFHASYVQMAENPYLTNYFREIYQRIFLRHQIEGLPAGRAKQVVLEHNDIFNAIRLKDVRKARQLIRQHIRTGKEYIFSAIRS